MAKSKLKMSNKRFLAITVPIMAIVLALTIGVTTAMSFYSSYLDLFLGRGDRHIISAEGQEAWDTSYYEAPYGSPFDDTDTSDSIEKSRNAAQAVSLEIAKEGIVLLKNSDNALPVAKNSKVTAFGRDYVDPIYGGTGSGGVSSTYNISAVDAMEAVYDVNPEVTSALNDAISGTSRGVIQTDQYYTSTYYIGEFETNVYNGCSFKGYTDAGFVFIGRAGGEGVDLSRDLKGDLEIHAATKISDGVGNFVANTETNRYEDGQHQLELNIEEKETIELAAQKCDKVIVIVNTSNPMELGWLEDNENVDAVVWIGGPGAVGFLAMASILCGETNPSGRTVDTYYADFTRDPVWNNYGRNIYSNITAEDVPDVDSTAFFGNNKNISATFVEYEEGIYVGYRYYETMYELLGSKGDSWYSAWKNSSSKASDTGVVYPFGFGLSYTSFSQQILSSSDFGDNIDITVRVTNTGSVAGKEVVQLYYGSEYTTQDAQYNIEKASKNLVAFEKTDTIQPGSYEDITVSFEKEDMASYCYTRNNSDGTVGCYTLGEGVYTVYLGKDAHSSWDSITWNNHNRIWYDNDNPRQSEKDAQSAMTDDGKIVDTPEKNGASYVAATNAFEECNEYMQNSLRNQLTRKNGTTAFTSWVATKPVGDGLIASDAIKASICSDYDFSEDDDPDAVAPELGKDNGLSLIDLRGKSYYDPLWDDLLSELTAEEMQKLILCGYYSRAAVDSVVSPSTTEADGPQGITGSFGLNNDSNCAWISEPVLASTFNKELAQKMGDAVGTEAITAGVSGWYAAAMNTHRSPFGGRLFEYYSEDGLLSGEIGAKVVSGAASKGLIIYIKHFALNDQETDRCLGDSKYGGFMAGLFGPGKTLGCSSVTSGGCVWANEQAIREIYLKPFELTVKNARATIKYISDENGTISEKVIRGSMGIMSSFNRIGSVWAGAHDGLLVNVARNEWNFNGGIVTDMNLYTHMRPVDSIMHGGDTILAVWPAEGWRNHLGDVEMDLTNAALLNAMVESSHHLLYLIVNSNAVQGIAPGTIILYDMSPWRVAMIAVNIVIYTLLAACAVWIVVRTVDSKKHPEKYKSKEII